MFEFSIIVTYFFCFQLIQSADDLDLFNPDRVYRERIPPINPYLTNTCTKTLCDPEYGCIRPVLYTRYVLALPPIAGCPEMKRKNLVRFLVVDKNKPDLLQSSYIIERGAKVCLIIHGMLSDYDQFPITILGLSTLRKFDYAVFVDWGYLSLVYGIANVPAGTISAQLAVTNTLLVGRIVCKYTHLLMKYKSIDPDNMKVVGFSAGSDMLATIGDYCKEKYHFQFHHFVGIDLPQAPFRYSNYPLTNYTHAKMVDLLYSTVALPKLIFEELQNILYLKAGALEAKASCSYIINPNDILIDQPMCHGLVACSHYLSPLIFSLAEMGRCLFKYSQCPPQFSPSSSKVGFTRFNCYQNPGVYRTCINTSLTPFKSC